MTRNTTKTKSAPALERGLRILEALSGSCYGMSLAQLCRRLALPRSSTHCLLLTLERQNFVHREYEAGRYVITPRLSALASRAFSGISVSLGALLSLRKLAKVTRLTAHMAVLQNNEVHLVAKVEPAGAERTASYVGQRVGAHCSSLGKALIAYLPEEELMRIVQGHPLTRNNENTITSVKALKEELNRVRQLGYALDNEEEELGMRCIGAPMFDSAGRIVAAVSVTGRTAQIHSGNIAELAVFVKQAALNIAPQLASPRKVSS